MIMTPLIPELYCSDIKLSLDFYINLLGFNIQYERVQDGFAMLERQGARIMLDELRLDSNNQTNRTWLTAPLEKPFGRGVNLQIETINVDALYARVQQSEARVFLQIEDKWYQAGDIELVNRQFIVLDPDGYMLRFFENIGTSKI